MLKNPAYAGAFVYGRTRTIRNPAEPHKIQSLYPWRNGKSGVNDQYPAYIDWPTYEQIQKAEADGELSQASSKQNTVAANGAALLHGIVYCGECGHKMVVQYKNSIRYICNYLRQQYGVPVCQFIPADTGIPMLSMPSSKHFLQ